MNGKRVLSMCLAGIIAVAMTACGDGNIPLWNNTAGTETYRPAPVVPEDIDAPDTQLVEKTEIQKLEEKYAAGNFEITDYKLLARLYEEDNRKMEARDTLELCYRLNEDAESYELLQDITVNAAEEEAMAQEVDLLIQN